MSDALQNIGPDRTLLLVDDDEPFLRRLERAMQKRGFDVQAAQSVAEGLASVKSCAKDGRTRVSWF